MAGRLEIEREDKAFLSSFYEHIDEQLSGPGYCRMENIICSVKIYTGHKRQVY